MINPWELRPTLEANVNLPEKRVCRKCGSHINSNEDFRIIADREHNISYFCLKCYDAENGKIKR